MLSEDEFEQSLQVFKAEAARAPDILRRERHSTKPPHEWLGPDPQLRPPGPNCPCSGCRIVWPRGD